MISMRVIKEYLPLRVTQSLQIRDHVFTQSLCHLSLDKTMSKMTPEVCALNTSIFMSKRTMTGVIRMKELYDSNLVCRHSGPCLPEAVRGKRESPGQLRTQGRRVVGSTKGRVPLAS